MEIIEKRSRIEEKLEEEIGVKRGKGGRGGRKDGHLEGRGRNK
jgi:hypothetical protein